MNIPAESLSAAIKFAKKRLCFTDDFVDYNKEMYTSFIEGYKHAIQVIEEKDKEISDLKKEIELQKQVLNMHQKSGRI